MPVKCGNMRLQLSNKLLYFSYGVDTLSLLTAHYWLFNRCLNILGWILIVVALLFMALTIYTNVVGNIHGTVYPWAALLLLMPMLIVGKVLTKINFIKVRKWAVGAGIISE